VHSDDPPVSVELLVSIAEARLGVRHGSVTLGARIESATIEELQALLSSIREIGPSDLLTLSRTLNDRREIDGGAPSHVGWRRRLRDLAVDSFVSRLHLTVKFPVHHSRVYTVSEISEVKRLVRAALAG
jgi:hypothetical protein